MSPMIPKTPAIGVRIAGSGCHYPEQKLTNADFERMVDTSDEWIVQRTGIRERRRCDPAKGESAVWLCTEALKKALADARMPASELDLIVLASVTGEMSCPSTACRVAANVGAGTAGAFDLLAACSGFVYAMTLAHDHIRMGRGRSVAVIGCDVMSSVMDYSDRGVSILFGDAAGAAILRATDDPALGIISSAMHADGSRWHDLYLPRKQRDFPEGASFTPDKVGHLQMNGREVYKFAVGTFCGLIEETLQKVGLDAHQIDHYICHQSNARMLDSARERFGLPHEKMYVNIDRFGNCSAGSIPVCLDELRRAGRVRDGQLVMFVAFGGGLTWSSSLWRL
ncbi:MAG: 3-oxoacyl-ACP synthase [Planctomycetes bacterium HGW-Planctomycetes-2]|nr:MAG: 3-oxoacyl-ACP synthase [Planctomycetes bacterium HGW-Planctomycetes-2]